MSFHTESEYSESNELLVSRLSNVHIMANILKAIHFKDVATVFATQNGLRFTVEDAQCVQANAFLQSALFDIYQLAEEQVIFKINLDVLLDCLNMFGSNPLMNSLQSPALKLCYASFGSPLSLLLEENGVITDCSIKTLEPDETLDFNFAEVNVINKIILKSDCIRDTFAELDMTSAILQISVCKSRQTLRLSTFGTAGSMHTDFPSDSEMMETFQCKEDQINRYKISLLKPSLKAAMLSSRISLRTDNRGFLSMQYLIKMDDGQAVFVEYHCSPDEDMNESAMEE